MKTQLLAYLGASGLALALAWAPPRSLQRQLAHGHQRATTATATPVASAWRPQRSLATTSAAADDATTSAAATAILFRPGDLRTQDHEALAMAAKAGTSVLPLAALDGATLATYTDYELASTHAALHGLSRSLEALGCGPLRTLTGATPTETAAALAGITSSVWAHDEPTAAAEAQLAALANAGVEVQRWRAQLRADAKMPADRSYPTYETAVGVGRGGTILKPPPPPAAGSLAPAAESPDGTVALPTLEALQALAAQARDAKDSRVTAGFAALSDGAYGDALWATPKPEACTEASATALLQEYLELGEAEFAAQWVTRTHGTDGGIAGVSLEHASMTRMVLTKGPLSTVVPEGHPLKPILSKVSSEPTSQLLPGEIFARVFSPLLALGCLSPRQVAEASERAHGTDTTDSTVPAEILSVESSEWHQLLARDDLETQRDLEECGIRYGYWRFRGHLVRYAVTDPDAGAAEVTPEGVAGGDEESGAEPDALLVHGFGASSSQWRKTMKAMVEASGGKRRVYALDLLGFGHSQAPSLTYTQYLWADQVREFGLSVVRRPYIVAGNSIGGFMSASVAADAGSVEKGGLVSGLALVNTAGRILDAETEAKETAELGGLSMAEATATGGLPRFSSPPNSVLFAFSRLLFAYLQPRIQEICKSVYPADPSQVDERLASDILRDSRDPGALNVMTSGAKLPPPRTLNELFAAYGGPILVLQGLEDPLNDAKSRADGMGRIGAKVAPLAAGHCPHDEKPEEVGRLLEEFAAAS